MAIALQPMCQSCPLKQECYQWREFDKTICKVYHARNVAREKVWFGE